MRQSLRDWRMILHISSLLCFLAVLVLLSQSANGAIRRNTLSVGTIVTIKGDEEMRFVDALDWLEAEIDQALSTGDTLRTGPFGGLAIVFRDQTQLRVHRNSLLVIRYIHTKPGQGNNRLKLERGAVWSRARRGFAFEGVTFETPSAIAAIRGTDWYLKVDEGGTTTLVVLDGSVEFFNEFGIIQVNTGEIATAIVGQAPTKRVLVAPKDRPRWVLDLSLEWFNMLSLTCKPVGTLDGADPVDPVQRAEVYYDRGDFASAEVALAQALETRDLAINDARSARIDMLQGFVLVRQHRFDEAARLLKQAAAKLVGRYRRIALLGIVGIYVERGRLQQADSTLKDVEREFGAAANIGMSRAWLQLFAGDYDSAIAKIKAVRSQFPNHARAAVLAAQLYLLIDEPLNMGAAISAALSVDPDDFLGWHWRALFYHKVDLNANLASAAYQKALKLNPHYGYSWNDLGLLYLKLGDYEKAEASLKAAIATDPKNALFQANYGVVLNSQERLKEAEQAYAAAEALEPNQSDALVGRGILALKRGLTDESIDLTLKANVADPAVLDGDILLGVGLYRAGEVQAAQETLANAARLCPNDPVPPQINSVIAQDQAEAGEAIRLAREAHDRLLRTGPPLGIEGVASSQSGITNVGSAYANLNLDDWGTYYGQLGFSPYLANSHFFLSNQYPSSRARSSANTQGLLLDPQAVSFPNRFSEFIRKPRNYLDISGTVGSEDGALFHTESITAQGFARIPNPFAYRVIASNSDNEGFRTNGQSDEQELLLGLGGWIDSSNYWVFRTNYWKQTTGLPDSRDISDPDDENEFEGIRAELGYQHRIHAQNRILVRLSGGYFQDEFANPRPFGAGLSNLTFSLMDTFGLDDTRWLFEQGLFYVDPYIPYFVVGPAGESLGLTRITDSIPNNIDLKKLHSLTLRAWDASLQARHMLRLGDIDVSYGSEFGIFRNELKQTQTVFSLVSPALLSDVAAGILPMSPLEFPFGVSELQETSDDFDQTAAVAYIDGLWEPYPDLRFQLGGFLRYFDNDIDDARTKMDPRIGIAWQPVSGHWLRAAAQREFILPFAETLAPVATVGLVAPDDFFQEGGSSTDFRIRWDAEWSKNFFTFAEIAEQQIEDFFLNIPLSSPLRFFAIDETCVRSVSVGSNIWFAERFGLFATYRRGWTENRSDGPNQGNDLPLIPDQTFHIGLTFVHPLQIRTTITQSYVGERLTDLENSATLDDYWITNLMLNWQPDDRRWSLTLGADNLFDRYFEVADGFPAPGLTVRFGIERRF